MKEELVAGSIMTHVSLARETACKPVGARFDSGVRLEGNDEK